MEEEDTARELENEDGHLLAVYGGGSGITVRVWAGYDQGEIELTANEACQHAVHVLQAIEELTRTQPSAEVTT